MIIGNGLIGKALVKIDESSIVFFASGVSNSLETRISEFEREKKLLIETLKQNTDKLFIYFSTCSILDPSKKNSLYIQHKLSMEKIIEENANKYLILRVSNVVGNGGNPNLLMNFLFRSFKEEKEVIIHQYASRNLIDIEDVIAIVQRIIINGLVNTIYNIAYPYEYKIIEIVEAFEKHFKYNINKNFIENGDSYAIPIELIKNYYIEQEKMDKQSYLQTLLEKYYT